MSEPYVFYIDGMTCTSCTGTIESYLKIKLSNKFRSFSVDLTEKDPKKTIIQLVDDDRDHKEVWTELKGYIEEIGFECRDYDYPNQSTDKKTTEQLRQEQTEEQEQQSRLTLLIAKAKSLLTSHWVLGIIGCVSGVAVLLACLGGLTLAFMIPIAIFSTLLTLILGSNSFYEAWKKWTKAETLTMDSLFALSAIAILAVSIASLFVPWLPMMFEAGLLIYGFRHIGIAIEDTIKEKIGTAKFQDRASKRVRKQTSSGFEETPLDEITIDEVIIVHPGEIIPLDGVCEEDSLIYNTIITGAILPRNFAVNEKVLAGMRLADNAAPLKIRVTRTQKNSYLARLDAAIEKSALEKAPIEIKTGKLLAYFIPTVIILSAVSGIIIGLFFPPAVAIQCAVSVLVSACPCTLGLITPLAVKTGMHKAAENGVQFKSAKTLQQTEQIDTVIFDLNGTLTTGVPLVKQIYLFDESNLSEMDLISVCAALEKESTHPIGKAIYSFANQHSNQKLDAVVTDNAHHSGISGRVKNQNYTIGSITLMYEKNIIIPPKFAQPHLDAGDQLVYVARDNMVVGFMVMTDPLRKDAYATIKALKAMGKDVHLCTGADEETALCYAKALKIEKEKVYANCIATSMNGNHRSKTAYIHSLRKKGHTVAMIGDAGNDAQAIAASDLGIAVASDGSDELTQQVAGIVIHTGTLLPIASAFAVSKQTVSNINQNLAMSLVYNIGSILFSGGLLVALGLTLNPISPVVGVGFMILQACFILLNVYRFKQQPLEHLQAENQQQEEHLSEESSHSKMNRHTPRHRSEPLVEHESTFTQNPEKNQSSSYSFWSCCAATRTEADFEFMSDKPSVMNCN
ncbi:MAG: heavy metal translocating P-type ATPase [Legionella sp.]